MWVCDVYNPLSLTFTPFLVLHHPTNPPHRDEYNKNKDQVLNLLVDKVTNVTTVVPEAWGVCTKH